jgi:hypothetical protein
MMTFTTIVSNVSFLQVYAAEDNLQDDPEEKNEDLNEDQEDTTEDTDSGISMRNDYNSVIVEESAFSQQVYHYDAYDAIDTATDAVEYVEKNTTDETAESDLSLTDRMEQAKDDIEKSWDSVGDALKNYDTPAEKMETLDNEFYNSDVYDSFREDMNQAEKEVSYAESLFTEAETVKSKASDEVDEEKSGIMEKISDELREQSEKKLSQSVQLANDAQEAYESLQKDYEDAVADAEQAKEIADKALAAGYVYVEDALANAEAVKKEADNLKQQLADAKQDAEQAYTEKEKAVAEMESELEEHLKKLDALIETEENSISDDEKTALGDMKSSITGLKTAREAVIAAQKALLDTYDSASDSLKSFHELYIQVKQVENLEKNLSNLNNYMENLGTAVETGQSNLKDLEAAMEASKDTYDAVFLELVTSVETKLKETDVVDAYIDYLDIKAKYDDQNDSIQYYETKINDIRITYQSVENEIKNILGDRTLEELIEERDQAYEAATSGDLSQKAMDNIVSLYDRFNTAVTQYATSLEKLNDSETVRAAADDLSDYLKESANSASAYNDFFNAAMQYRAVVEQTKSIDYAYEATQELADSIKELMDSNVILESIEAEEMQERLENCEERLTTLQKRNADLKTAMQGQIITDIGNITDNNSDADTSNGSNHISNSNNNVSTTSKNNYSSGGGGSTGSSSSSGKGTAVSKVQTVTAKNGTVLTLPASASTASGVTYGAVSMDGYASTVSGEAKTAGLPETVVATITKLDQGDLSAIPEIDLSGKTTVGGTIALIAGEQAPASIYVTPDALPENGMVWILFYDNEKGSWNLVEAKINPETGTVDFIIPNSGTAIVLK